jgi:hypothetical protein
VERDRLKAAYERSNLAGQTMDDVVCTTIGADLDMALRHVRECTMGQVELVSSCRPHLNNMCLPSWVIDWSSKVKHCLGAYE